MTVDVVAEERGRFGGDAAGPAVWQQAALDESLETVAYAQDKAAALLESLDGCAHAGVANHAGDELAAAVRLVSGGESAAERQDVALVYTAAHLVYGVLHILTAEVAEHEGPDLCSSAAESLGSVVVAVGAREHRHAHHGMLHGSTGICLHIVPCQLRHLILSGIHPWRINAEVAALVGLFQFFKGDVDAVYHDIGCSDLAKQLRAFQFAPGFEQH